MNKRFRSADEAKEDNIAKMGKDLGQFYSALWQSIGAAHIYWGEYVELFGTKPERIELLNRAAPNFFHMLQEQLWDMSLLHLAKLTDPEKSFGKNEKKNLTVQALPNLIENPMLKKDISELVTASVKATSFCRDWRNRKIAHHDLRLALQEEAVPLESASRLNVKNALQTLNGIINVLARHFHQSEILFDSGPRLNGVVSLLYLLRDGMKMRDDRRSRFRAGQSTPEDFAWSRYEI